MPPRTLDAHIDVIRQYPYPGQQTAERHVKVMVPGRFFPSLRPSERAVNYEGEASEYTERRQFKDHVAWGAAHKGPGIRFVCNSNAVEDPDNRGFWTPLQLFNRWRHNTYKDDREAEMQYLDAAALTTCRARRPPPPPPTTTTTISAPKWGLCRDLLCINVLSIFAVKCWSIPQYNSHTHSVRARSLRTLSALGTGSS